MNTEATHDEATRRSMDSRHGFTLIEMLVALGMLTVVLVGALILLDTTNRVTRAQLARADIQQSIRIAQDSMIRHVRSAGRGGLLGQTLDPEDELTDEKKLELPAGVAVKVENNVGTDRTLFIGDIDSPSVLAGTDILTLRGIFDNPLYYTEFLDKSVFTVNPTTNTGSIEISTKTPEGDFVQDLSVLEQMRQEAVASSRTGDAVIMVSPFSDDVYGVAEIDWDNSSLSGDTFTLAFLFEDDRVEMDLENPSDRIVSISGLSANGVFPSETLARSGFKTVAVLQEYRYFIRNTNVSGDLGGRFAPKLSRTRTKVNQDAYWDTSQEFEDIANNVIDLQVALGFSDDDVNAGAVTESADGQNDSWHLNAIEDSAGSLPTGDLAFIRITSLARAAAPDRNFEARALLGLEDHTYTASDLNDLTERRHRRFFLQTVVDVRNL